MLRKITLCEVKRPSLKRLTQINTTKHRFLLERIPPIPNRLSENDLRSRFFEMLIAGQSSR
jgi:hypothetical protein